MLAAASLHDLDLAKVGLAVALDVETTGFRYDDKIVELALSLFAFGRESGRILGLVDEYCGFQDPQMPMPYGAQRVHGISDDDVRGKELDRERVIMLLKQAEFIVAHNASFDKRFITAEFPQTERMVWLCSCRDIAWKQKGFTSAALQHLLKCHQISVERQHRALDDVHATLLLLSQVDGERTYFAEMVEKMRKSVSYCLDE